MELWRGIVLSGIIVALTSCGGGGGSNSSSQPVTLPTSPTPTPPPAPTPPPTPPPPTISAVSGSDVLAVFEFYENGIASFPNLDGFFRRFGDRKGKYPGTGSISSNQGLGTFNVDYADFEKSAFGIDSAGSLRFGAQAPADSLVISPLTSLLLGTNTETKLKEQIGLTGSLFELASDRPLKTFVPNDELASTDDVARADAERLIAHQIRVTAVTVAIDRVDGILRVRDDLEFGYDLSNTSYSLMSQYLDTAPATFIYTNAEMSKLLGSGLGRSVNATIDYRDDVISAAAHIVNAYAAAIGVRIADRQTAARFQLGISGFLIPELDLLLAENTAEAAAVALSITTQQILDQTARFNEQLLFVSDANFFPQPDFYLIPSDGQLIVPADGRGSVGAGPFNDNDVAISVNANNGNFFIPGMSNVTGVDVPSINQTEISAVLNNDGTVTITPNNSFVGVTYFDYSVAHDIGENRTGRVYIIVK